VTVTVNIHSMFKIADPPSPAFERTGALLQGADRLPDDDEAADSRSDGDETVRAELFLGCEREQDVHERCQKTRGKSELLETKSAHTPELEKECMTVPLASATFPSDPDPARAVQ
jgi:hypothetical protein